MKKNVAIFFCLQLISLCSTHNVLAANADYEYRSVCPLPSGGRYSSDDIDKWNFYKCECVSYVAQMINKNGFSFENKMKSPSGYSGYYQDRWDNAKYWKEKAISLGYSVSSTPVIGAIAWWSAKKWNKNMGHVAYVDSVSNNGKANISEYNFKPEYGFGTRNGVVADAYIIFNSKPTAPANLTSSASGTSIKLRWNDVSSNESGFNVYRWHSSYYGSSNIWVLQRSISENSTSYVNAGLGANTTYFYKVCAYNTDGESCSAATKATTDSSGISWDGESPSGTQCEKDAITVASQSNSYGEVQLRKSMTCNTYWTRVIPKSSSYSTYGEVRRTIFGYSLQANYTTSGKGKIFTKMLYDIASQPCSKYAPPVQVCASGSINGYSLNKACQVCNNGQYGDEGCHVCTDKDYQDGICK